MTESPQNWIEELSDVQLPALAGSKQQLRRALDRPSTSHTDLGLVFSQDPGLALALFREMSLSERRPAEPVVSPTRIISLLGLSRVSATADATPTLEERYRGAARDGLRICYSRAILASRLAHRLGVLRGKAQIEHESLTALLQNIGEMALWARKPGTMGRLTQACTHTDDLDFISLRTLGNSPTELGRALALKWQLPPAMVDAQGFYHSFDTNLQTPLLGAALAWTGWHSWNSEQSRQMVLLAAEHTHLDVDLIQAELHKEAVKATRITHALGLPHSIDSLLQIPGKPANKTRHLKQAVTSESKQATAKLIGTSAQKATAQPAAKPADPRKTKNGVNPLQQRLGATLKKLQNDLDMARVMFAILTADREHIRARMVLEDAPSGLKKFSVSAKTRNLFSLVVNKPSALWINSGNQVKYLPYIPEEVVHLVNTQGFFLATVMANRKAIGLLYADIAGKPLSETQFTGFKQACAELSRLLNRPK